MYGENETFEHLLTLLRLRFRLISFGFNCHNSDLNAGMSVPLLSVTLACLMAIFRSDDLPKQVQVEDLTILVKDAGKALLDPRLASSATTASSLDEETSTQMVRAINKVCSFKFLLWFPEWAIERRL